MKTLSDVAAFLKRNPNREIIISYSERRKCFEVTYDRTPSTSKYLDDALEGLSETLRRRASGTISGAKYRYEGPTANTKWTAVS